MAITTRDVPYSDGDVALHGVLAWDDAAGAPLPGILLVHGGAGLDDHAREQARRYAALGHTVFACDMFGDGVIGDRERMIARLVGMRDDPTRLVQRARAGVAALVACPEADGCLAAVGFCFGGLTVITLARFGTDIAGVISMHGALATKAPAQPGAVRAKILACHGASDPHVPWSDVVAFSDEMTNASANWQLIAYGGAVHGFTHRNAVPGATPGVEYHEATDRRSFAAAQAFLEELPGARRG